MGSIPGSVRFSGGGNGNPLQCSCLKNPMDRGTWQATVQRLQRVGHDQQTEHALYNTRNYIQYSVINRNEKNMKKYEPLCCTAEINT